MPLGDDRKPTANKGFAIIDLNDRDKAMFWCLGLIETNSLGYVDYHKSSTLSIRCVLWGCMEVQTMVKHAFTSLQLNRHSEACGTFLHFSPLGLEGGIFR